MKPIAHRLITPDNRFTIFPLHDVHYPEGELPILQAWVERVQEAECPVVFFVGDLFDAFRTTYRKHLRSYTGDATSQGHIDRLITKDVEAFLDIVSPLHGKVIAAVSGNHTYEMASGINTDQLVCQALGVQYLGAIGGVRMVVGKDRHGALNLTVVMHHTAGSNGTTKGADLAALQRFEQKFEADVYLSGHTHNMLPVKVPKLSISQRGEPILIERTKAFVRGGTMLKSYKEREVSADKPFRATYAEEKLLAPSALGWVEVHGEIAEERTSSRGKVHHVDYKFWY